MRRFARALLLLSTVALTGSVHAGAALKWNALRNPVLSYPNWSIKDPALAWERGAIYVFNGLIHENYQFLRIGNVLHMLSDDYRDNIEGEYLYTLTDAAQPLNWERGFEIRVPLEGFNSSIRCQAASLYDRRADDGYFYMIYAGSNEQTAYLGRGWNRLALVRSKDLVHWFAPGSGFHSITP